MTAVSAIKGRIIIKTAVKVDLGWIAALFNLLFGEQQPFGRNIFPDGRADQLTEGAVQLRLTDKKGFADLMKRKRFGEVLIDISDNIGI